MNLLIWLLSLKGGNNMSRIWECPCCESRQIEQVTSGQRVSDVISVTVDGGLNCSFKIFLPQLDDYATFYRCKNCLAILPFANTEALVDFIQGEGDGKI